MALNPGVLAAALTPPIKAAHIAVGAAPNPALDTFCADLATAIASAVVTHIQSAGVVAVVTACPAGAGTGTGAIT
jgi:hypothetical protein